VVIFGNSSDSGAYDENIEFSCLHRAGYVRTHARTYVRTYLYTYLPTYIPLHYYTVAIKLDLTEFKGKDWLALELD